MKDEICFFHARLEEVPLNVSAFEYMDLSCAGKLDCLQRPPVIIGIDPDSNGALAVVQVDAYPQPGAQVIQDVVVRLHDNPCEILQATKQRKRRWVCIHFSIYLFC